MEPLTSANVQGPGKEQPAAVSVTIAHCENVRGLGKSMVVFALFEKLRC